MIDETTTDQMDFVNGRVNIVYHNGMASLRLHPSNGKRSTVEQYIADIQKHLLNDEHIELGETAVHVYKTYGLKDGEL